MLRKGDKLLSRVLGKKAAQAAATKLKAMHDAGRRGRNWLHWFESHLERRELFAAKAGADPPLEPNNIDHHRSADYTGLITALGDSAGDSLLTMEQLYQSKAVLLVGNDPTNQNPARRPGKFAVAFAITATKAVRHQFQRDQAEA